MNRLFATTAVALLLGLAPALAAEEFIKSPTGAGVSPEASQEATQPDTGSADTSGGAAEQSSAPPSSGAASAQKSAEGQSSDEFQRREGAKLGARGLVCCRDVEAQSDHRRRQQQAGR